VSVTGTVRRLAHVSFTFVMMNVAAVAALLTLRRRTRGWR
jgi:hypothetical protein